MRLGTTSFIFPGSWLYNVERLAPHFDDIEILLFEAESPSSFPTAEECRALARCKREHNLSYSVHTPLAASLASEDPARRAAGVRCITDCIQAAATLDPDAFVLHVYLGDGEHDRHAPTDLDAWRGRAADSLEKLLSSGIAPRQLCVESLDYDFSLIEPVLEALDLSVALDVGHLVRDGRDELSTLRRLRERTRIIQWHGTEPGARDHRSLRHYPPARGRALLKALIDDDYTGVLTLEVFRERDLLESSALVVGWLQELGKAPARAPLEGLA